VERGGNALSDLPEEMGTGQISRLLYISGSWQSTEKITK
jgi:hypothetical protein